MEFEANPRSINRTIRHQAIEEEALTKELSKNISPQIHWLWLRRSPGNQLSNVV